MLPDNSFRDRDSRIMASKDYCKSSLIDLNEIC